MASGMTNKHPRHWYDKETAHVQPLEDHPVVHFIRVKDVHSLNLNLLVEHMFVRGFVID